MKSSTPNLSRQSFESIDSTSIRHLLQGRESLVGHLCQLIKSQVDQVIEVLVHSKLIPQSLLGKLITFN